MDHQIPMSTIYTLDCTGWLPGGGTTMDAICCPQERFLQTARDPACSRDGVHVGVESTGHVVCALLESANHSGTGWIVEWDNLCRTLSPNKRGHGIN